jgi:hypothetical protein
VSCGTRRDTPLSVHALLEVSPPLPGNLDLPLRQLAGVLAEHVKQNEEVRRASVEDPVQLSPVVTPQLSQLAFDLRRVRKRQMRVRRREHVEPVDLEVDRGLPVRIAERFDELVDRL